MRKKYKPYKTRAYFITRMYWGMKYRAEVRDIHKGFSIKFTFVEFKEWVNKQPNFQPLWIAYLESARPKRLAPSIDRINNSLGYFFENMQVISHSNNISKRHTDERIITGKLPHDHKEYKKLWQQRKRARLKTFA